MKTEVTTLEKYAQVISTDLMEALKESALDRGVSLEVEIALRLMANLTHQELTTDGGILGQIARQEFTEEEAVAECKRKREAHHYLFEIEKLRNFLRFAPGLPRHVKETFTLIDVKAETPRIQAEIDEENKRNQE